MKTIFKVLIINLIVCVGYIPTIAQPLSKVWDKRFGGASDDGLRKMVSAPDGGYLLGGTSSSLISGDKTQDTQGPSDFWVVKINSLGIKEWDKQFGGSDGDELSCIVATSDGGYLLGGTSGGAWYEDYWIIKVDVDGNELWNKRFGGVDRDYLTAIAVSGNGGFLLGGYSKSGIGGDKSQDSRGNNDYWVIRIDDSGNQLWDKRFGGQGGELLRSIIPMPFDGFLLGGTSESSKSPEECECESDLTYDTAEDDKEDFWVIRINSTGEKLWDRTFGGNDGRDILTSMVMINDGVIFLGGSSDAISGRSKTQEPYEYYGQYRTKDFWVVRIDDEGRKGWDKRFGGNKLDEIRSMVATAEGGAVLAGISYSEAGGDKSQEPVGDADYWLVKIDNMGEVLWDQQFGGIGFDDLSGIEHTSEGGFLLSGRSNSGIGGDKSQESQGETDYWVVKMGNSCTPPTASISTSAAIICNGTSTTINFTGTPGAVVTYYSLPNGSGNQTVTLSLLDGTASISTGNLIANEIYYLVSAANPDNPTCSQTLTGSTQVMVRGVPYATISGNTTICSGTSTNITFGGLGNSIITYQLNGGENQTITLSNPGSPDWTNSISTGNITETATYTVISAELPGNPSCLTDITGQSATVSISGSPTISLSNSQACAGEAATLTTTAGFDSYSWSSSGGSFTSTTNEATFSSVTAGGYSFTVTVTRTSGCSATCTTSLTVNASTAVSIAGSTLIACAGQEVNLTVTSGFSSHSWASSGGTFTSTTNEATFSSNVGGEFQFTVTVTGSGGCVGTATSSVFVRGVPAATISNNSIICTGTGNTITFSSPSADAISGVFVNYRVNGQVFSVPIVNGTASIETGDLTTTTTYELFRMGYLASVTCPTPITGQSATVTVRPNPTATISNSSIICTGTGNTITFSSPSADEISGVFVNYRVNGQVFSVPIVNGTASIETGNLTTTTTYELFRVGYLASVTCPTNITGQSATVTVRPNPTATISGNTSVCVGSSTNLTITATPETRVNYTVNGGAWQLIEIGSTGIGILSTGNLSTTAIYNLTRVGYAASVTCPVTITDQSATVMATPPTAILVGATQYCTGETINLSVVASCGTPSSYSWTGPNGFGSRASSISIENARTTRSGTYQVQVVFPSGTISLSVSVTILPPLDVKVSTNTPVCVGQTVTLSFSQVPVGSTALWQGPQNFSSTSLAPVIVAATVLNEGTYLVTVTQGSCTISTTTFVEVNPTLSLAATSNSAICDGETLRLTAVAAGTSGFSWKGPKAFSATLKNPTLIAARPTNSGVYSVTLTAVGSCSVSATTSVVVNANPTVVITTESGKTILCNGSSLVLSAVSTGATVYAWFKGNSNLGIGRDLTITTSGNYRVEVGNATNCSATTSVSITTTAPPTVTATNTVTGTTIKLTANPAGLRYSWSGPVAFTSTVRNPSITNATVANAGIYTLQGLMVSTGCTATATTSVVVGSPTNRLTANAVEQETTDWVIKAYPNPTNHILIVEVVLPEASAVQFSLMDITGREKAAWRHDEVTTNHRLEINMSAYDDGLWLLQAQHKTGSKTKKIWKIK